MASNTIKTPGPGMSNVPQEKPVTKTPAKAGGKKGTVNTGTKHFQDGDVGWYTMSNKAMATENQQLPCRRRKSFQHRS